MALRLSCCSSLWVPQTTRTPLHQMLLPSAFYTAESQVQLLSVLKASLSHSPAIRVLLIVIIFLTTTLLFVYTTTWLSFVSQRRSRASVKVPPTVPYMIPFLGSALSFGINHSKCVSKSSQQAGSEPIYGLKILHMTLYFVSKPENVAKIRKYKSTITTPGVTAFVLKTLFGMTPEAINMYTSDASGIHSKPVETSLVAPRNRVDHLTHASFHKHLLGEGLLRSYQRFSIALLGRLPSLNVQDGWTEFPDIMDFWLEPLTASMTEALVGNVLECLNPNFNKSLLRYMQYTQDLMKGLPRWWIPEAYRLRKSLIGDVKKWHALARTRFKESDVDEDGAADPWWGSAFIRERQKILREVDNWGADAIASSDFGIIWGASINIHPMAIWNVIEIFRDHDLLLRVRAELKRAALQGITSAQDIEKLMSLPLLQSICAELLRLRVETPTVFSSYRDDIHINGWRIPKDNLVLVRSGAAHRDPDFWNTKNDQHPLDQFWADRFLVYPGDPQSGPRKESTINGGKSEVQAREVPISPTEGRFVTSGLADSFIPWGVGERSCPGRGIARRVIVAVVATMVERYDIEILSSDFTINTAFDGIGTQRPLRRIPFRIRNRK